jgi:hypothetical protein
MHPRGGVGGVEGSSMLTVAAAATPPPPHAQHTHLLTWVRAGLHRMRRLKTSWAPPPPPTCRSHRCYHGPASLPTFPTNTTPTSHTRTTHLCLGLGQVLHLHRLHPCTPDHRQHPVELPLHCPRCRTLRPGALMVALHRRPPILPPPPPHHPPHPNSRNRQRRGGSTPPHQLQGVPSGESLASSSWCWT